MDASGDVSTSTLRAFLAPCGPAYQQSRALMFKVLQRAGFEVLEEHSSADTFSDVHCAVFLLGAEPAHMRMTPEENHLIKACYQRALHHARQTPSFRLVFWEPPDIGLREGDKQMRKWVREARNQPERNTMVSRHPSSVMLVEELRAILRAEQQEAAPAEPTDIFLLYNALDEQEADSIAGLLEDVARVKRQCLRQRDTLHFEAEIAGPLRQARLGVIYYAQAPDWAHHFAQQLWKMTGGASGPTPLFLVGNADREASKAAAFEAPGLEAMHMARELIPLEIKVRLEQTAHADASERMHEPMAGGQNQDV